MTAQVLYDVLINDAPVVAIVSDRISPVIRAQDETLPCVTVTTVSVVPANIMDGVPTLDTCRVQVDAWASTYAGARSLATACRLAIETAGHTMEDEFSSFESDVNEYRVTQDYSVMV